MRVAISQINTTLADFEYNLKLITDQIQILSQKKAELIVFPEASLFGYHPFDLLERKELVKDQLKALKRLLLVIPQDVYVLVGGFSFNESKLGRPFYNSAFLCTRKKIIKEFHKTLLPVGDVFDEGRFIENGEMKNNYFKIKNKTFFLTICEDIWGWKNPKNKSQFSLHKINPIEKVKKKKVDLVINMSASPYSLDKFKERQFYTLKTAQYFKAPLLYTNLVGAQDEVIYDGQSFLIDPKNKTHFVLSAFEEDHNVFELDTLKPWSPQRHHHSSLEELRKALVLGIRDFAKKIKVNKIHLGLSGGIDSALVAALAVDAIGPQNVTAFALPTRFNQSESLIYAKKLAQNLNIKFQVIEIEKMFNFIKSELDCSFEVSQFQLMHENLQSRLRGLTLMAYSNLKGSLLLTTGNKDEYATGYATLYGDMCGGLAPIGDLTKKQVRDLCRHYNKGNEIIPPFIIERPPSAELRPDQKDEDSLLPYDRLDKTVDQIVRQERPTKSKDDHWLIQKLMTSEFKRWQAAPILKVTSHAFGRGRRYPIAHSGRK